MGWLKNFFSRWKLKNKSVYVEEEEDQREVVLCRDSVNIHESQGRVRYVHSCLEQMKDAEREISDLTKEYSLVTTYLTDMEEIEALPAQEKQELEEVANKIFSYEREKHYYEKRSDRMPEEQFGRIERMEAEVEEGIRALSEAEEYQEKIHQDMTRLSAERHACQYRRHEMKNTMANMRGMLIICCFAFFGCMGILMVLQFMMGMETRLGYILTAAATALAVFFIYLRYTDADRERLRLERAVNRLILLQNKVKIRYVNNINLLDYLYVKYQAESAEQLSELWEAYQKEKAEREKFRELHTELDFLRKDLLKILRRYQVHYPEIWLNQTQAIINKKEMVEIRHGLILRRQKLRKQMEYNEELARTAQTEIKSLAEEYPVYREEIMELVSRYEQEERATG